MPAINIYEVCKTKLKVGETRLQPISHRGRTLRERVKNLKRLDRRVRRQDALNAIRAKSGGSK